MKRLLLGTFMLAQLFVNAQAPTPADSTQTDLKALELTFKKNFETQRQRAEEIAASRGIKLRKEFADGSIMEFCGFDSKGNLLFEKTDNIGSGRTISTNKVWPGGSTGTSLTGAGMTNRLGVWDGGAVLTTHQEFGGRVVQVDGASGLSDHATHVSGTMVASGVSANARGMSYEAPLRAYDWSNDESEMTAAGSAGMLVSNHSYGRISGWFYNQGDGNWYWYGDPTISNTEDWQFGFYDTQANEWDQIAYNNPNYLICKSAGNDRGDNKTGSTWYYSDGTQGSGTAPAADGQYDCISANGVSKNVLTVGAVNKINSSNSNNGWTQTSDVVMSSFSGWGPADDGRIKPDVVAAGVNIYSSVSSGNTDYDGTYDGTSMATPAVAGSLILVQQHHNNLKGRFMKASTLKAIAIHTADEAGNAGPDYQFGWGLLNTAKAVQLITDSITAIIQEKSLNNAATYSQGITTDGVRPLKITICWTDRPGTPVAESLDPSTRMLVNDLDIRLTRLSDNTVFFPYILNPSSPSAVATTGDNIRDNVEQIYLTAPVAGNYTVTVSHKGSLASAQAYSLIIEGVAAKPTALFTASSRVICTGNSITFTDISAGNPSSRMWYFPGGNPSVSIATTPSVNYPVAGNYPVALRVTNSLGSDSVYIFNYVTVGGNTLPFSENFETTSPSVSQWTITNPNADTTWRFADVSGNSPGNRAYCLPFYNIAVTGRVDGLNTPVLSFRGHTNISLSFQYAYTKDPSVNTDSLRIYVSTNCGSSYTRIAGYGDNGTGNFITSPTTASFFAPTTAANWSSLGAITVNLNAYAGMNNIRIRFEGYNRSSNNLYIDNISITGTPLKPTPNFFASKKTICVNEPINFFDSTLNFPTSWNWTFNGANTISSTNQFPTGISYSTPGTYAVKLVTANASGADSITKTNYITVLPTPNAPNIRNVKPLTFCAGDSTILLTDSNAFSYKWYKNNTLIPGETSPTIIAKDSGSYTVISVNANGCATSSSPIAVISYVMPAIPVVTSNLSADVFCQGGTAVLTSSANTGNQWYKDNSPLSGQTGKTLSTQDTGLFYTIVTNGICSSKSNEKTIRMYLKPLTSDITGPSTVEVDQTASYNVTAKAGSTFAWTITNGSITSGNGTANISVKWNSTIQAASVKVQETSTNNCKGDFKTLDIAMTWHTALEEKYQFGEFSVYPNPANDQLTVSFVSTIKEPVILVLRDVLGKEVISIPYLSSGMKEHIPVSLAGINKGVYFLEVKSAHVSKITRLFVK